MRVLVFHGYLLRGTGSNVYNAELAAALLRLGHEVHLVCQERHAGELPFVGAVGDWDTGELVVERTSSSACTVYRPNIGRLLPVYVPDRYEDVDTRPFEDLTDAELDAYLRANVDAVADVVVRSMPDVALANHLVMGPVILARALSATGVPYAVKIHGSALEYTVKPHPRFLPYAREGVAPARGILVGSRHTAESLWDALDDRSLPPRTRLGPPGVDIARFRPRDRGAVSAEIRSLADDLALRSACESASVAAERAFASRSVFERDQAATARALHELAAAAAGDDPVVGFVGKLIVAKGIDLLLLAWPLVLAGVPAAKLAIVGFGAYEDAARQLIDALAGGDLRAVAALVRAGRTVEGGPASALRFAASFLEWLERSGERARYLTAARAIREQVTFTGRLEHDELAVVLPSFEALVVPSTFPESFGMVTAEAAACGVLPISASHSGLAEVSRTVGSDLPERVRQLVSFALGPDVVRSIAASVLGWLRTDAGQRDTVRRKLAETVAERYSWESVATGVIAAARGELDTLEAPA